MTTQLTTVIISHSQAATEQLGRRLGQRLKGGELIELVSDLGGGKTTFVRGLASGMGSLDKVSSPSFTISKVYTAGSLELRHFDFYRLPEAGLMEYELRDLLADPAVVVAIEWGLVVQHVLPENHLTIRFEVAAETERKISLDCPESLAYLVAGL